MMSATIEAAPRWDLSAFYAGVDDPAILRDLDVVRAGASHLREQYRGKVHTLDEAALAVALRAFEAHSIQCWRLMAYAWLTFSADSTDDSIQRLLGRVRGALSAIEADTQFFELELQQLSADTFESLAASPVLEGWSHYLRRLRNFIPHTLPEGEERVMTIKDVTGQQAWQQLYTEMCAAMRIDVPGAGTLTLSDARALRQSPDRTVREAATISINQAFAERAHVLTFIFNTIFEDHRQSMELRHYDDPMAQTLLGDDLDAGVIDALMGATEAHYPLVQRYYRLKAEVLGLGDFRSHDVLAPLARAEQTICFSEAQDIVLDAFQSFSPEFGKLAQTFFENRRIDVPPAPGKQGGAFCAGLWPGMQPYVLLNFTGKLDDVSTLAHELGHGIHFMLAGETLPLQSFHPIIPLAETASTFAELITVNRLLQEQTDPDIRLQLMASRIETGINTIMRQVMVTRWEKLAHARRREGFVSAEIFCELWERQNLNLTGCAVIRNETDRWGWISVPHLIQSRFYCYSYAFGQLLVYALYQQYLEEGESFVPKLLEILRAGGSRPVTDVLADVGIDIHDPNLWRKGLNGMTRMVDEFEAAIPSATR
jgi:oligoendopeptidase F